MSEKPGSPPLIPSKQQPDHLPSTYLIGGDAKIVGSLCSRTHYDSTTLASPRRERREGKSSRRGKRTYCVVLRSVAAPSPSPSLPRHLSSPSCSPVLPFPQESVIRVPTKKERKKERKYDDFTVSLPRGHPYVGSSLICEVSEVLQVVPEGGRVARAVRGASSCNRVGVQRVGAERGNHQQSDRPQPRGHHRQHG